MRNIIIITTSIIIAAISGYGQTFELLSDNQEKIKNNDTVVVVYDKENSIEEISYFYLINKTDSEKNFIINKDDGNIQSGTLSYFCFGTTCYTPFASTSDIEVLSANETNDSFSTYFVPDNIDGNSYVAYSISDPQNPNEVLTFYIKYTTELSVGVSNVEKELLNLSFNQENKKLHVNNLSNEKSQINVYNLSGSIVYKVDINNEEMIIDLSSYQSGLYLYQVTSTSRILKSGKIMIK